MTQKTIDTSRRRFLTAATTVVGAVGVAYAAVPFLSSFKPSAKAQAAGAPVEIDLSKLEPGARITVEWRRKPVWVVRRTEDSLERLQSLDPKLRDPDSLESEQPIYAKNTYRSIKPEYLVLVGICTHLGCSPAYRPELGSVEADWMGGFFCPCHGSKFDLAGRVYQGVPAPTNMVVPSYTFLSDTRVLIGVDKGDAA